MKTKLTPYDKMKLEAARGLGQTDDEKKLVGAKLPTVEQYNRAIERQQYTGQPIIPIGGTGID